MFYWEVLLRHLILTLSIRKKAAITNKTFNELHALKIIHTKDPELLYTCYTYLVQMDILRWLRPQSNRSTISGNYRSGKTCSPRL